MNIYAQENCNDYKSTQNLQLSDSTDPTGCINIDWAESFAVDVKGAQAGEGCTFNYSKEVEDGEAQQKLITNEIGSCEKRQFLLLL